MIDETLKIEITRARRYRSQGIAHPAGERSTCARQLLAPLEIEVGNGHCVGDFRLTVAGKHGAPAALGPRQDYCPSVLRAHKGAKLIEHRAQWIALVRQRESVDGGKWTTKQS